MRKSRCFARSASTGPWATSDMVVRKKKSRSSAAVSSGDVAEGLTVGMAKGALTRSMTRREFALDEGPTIACTPSSSTSRLASAAAVSGSRVESAMTVSTGRPKTPPAALTCLMASSNAWRRSTERLEAPLKFSSSPMRSGPTASPVGAPRLSPSAHPTAAAASASAAARTHAATRLRRSLMLPHADAAPPGSGPALDATRQFSSQRTSPWRSGGWGRAAKAAYSSPDTRTVVSPPWPG